MRNERRKMKVMEWSRKSEETLTSCMDEMRQTRGHLETWATRCVQGMSVTTQTEQELRGLTLRACSRVTQVCHVIVGFHVLRVDVTLNLGFHVVIVSDVSPFSFTTHTQFQVQSSSGCCSPTLSCHRQFKLYPKFLHISHRENGSFEVLSLHPPSVTVDRRQL